MAKKKRIPAKYQVWIDARKRHKLSHAQIQMARELGMNPKKFGGMDNHRQERWKLPLGQFIEECYLKSFGKLPSEVLSIEQLVKRQEKKKTERREAKRLRREAEAAAADMNAVDSFPPPEDDF
jgi:hypothetical protein